MNLQYGHPSALMTQVPEDDGRETLEFDGKTLQGTSFRPGLLETMRQIHCFIL